MSSATSSTIEWSRAGGLSDTTRIVSMARCYSDGLLYAADDDGRLLSSSDNGKFWTQAEPTGAQELGAFHTLSEAGSNRVVAGCDGGVAECNGEGEDWQKSIVLPGMPSANASVPYVAALPTGEWFARTAAGVARLGELLPQKLWFVSIVPFGPDLLIAAVNAPDVNVECDNGNWCPPGVYVSPDRGIRWFRRALLEEKAVDIDRFDDGTLVMATSSGVRTSSDFGQNWTRLPLPVAVADDISAVLLAGETTVLVGTRNGSFRSDDRGATWFQCSDTNTERIECFGRGFEGRVFKSTDRGLLYGDVLSNIEPSGSSFNATFGVPGVSFDESKETLVVECDVYQTVPLEARILDSSGQLFALYVPYQFDPGTRSMRIDIVAFPPDSYTLSIASPMTGSTQSTAFTIE